MLLELLDVLGAYRRLSKPFTLRQERVWSYIMKNFLISTLREHRDSPGQYYHPLVTGKA
jgi:hypothetical protein